MSIDYTSFPGIVDHFLSYTDRETWLVLRAVCSRFREAYSRRLWGRVTIRIHDRMQSCTKEPPGHGPYNPHGVWGAEFFTSVDLDMEQECTQPAPGLDWNNAAGGSDLTAARLAKYLDVLDVEDPRVDFEGLDCPTPELDKLNLLSVPRVVRRWALDDMSFRHPFPVVHDYTGWRTDQIFIAFLDYTYSPEVREFLEALSPDELTPDGESTLAPPVPTFPEQTVNFECCPPLDMAIVNVRYDPRTPLVKYGRLTAHDVATAREVVVLFSPIEMWTGPRPPVDAETRDGAWRMGILFRFAHEVMLNLCEEVSPQSHRELITRSFVFVGAEQFDAFWVDAPDSPFTNPLTSAALHAGFVDAVKFHHEEWFEDEPFPDEALQKRGGWDEAVKFMTLDEWQKRVPEDIYRLATVPPAQVMFPGAEEDEEEAEEEEEGDETEQDDDDLENAGYVMGRHVPRYL